MEEDRHRNQPHLTAGQSGHRGLSRRQFLAASAGAAALSVFEWTPIFQVPAASAQSTLTRPPKFPSTIPLYQQAFRTGPPTIPTECSVTHFLTRSCRSVGAG
jgi:hypothetical protein